MQCEANSIHTESPNRLANADARGSAVPCKGRWARAGCQER